MSDEITVRPYQEINNKILYEKPLTLKLADLLKVYVASENETVSKFAVAILNYGAAAQTYFAYKTDSLANASLTEEQKNVAPAGNYTKASAMPLDGATAKIIGISLLLEDMINLKLIVETEVEGAVVQIGGDASFESYTEIELERREDGVTYKAISFGFLPGDYDLLCYYRVVDANGKPISRTVAYSIAAYCQNMQADEKVGPVANAILALIDAVPAPVES